MPFFIALKSFGEKVEKKSLRIFNLKKCRNFATLCYRKLMLLTYPDRQGHIDKPKKYDTFITNSYITCRWEI